MSDKCNGMKEIPGAVNITRECDPVPPAGLHLRALVHFHLKNSAYAT